RGAEPAGQQRAEDQEQEPVVLERPKDAARVHARLSVRGGERRRQWPARAEQARHVVRLFLGRIDFTRFGHRGHGDFLVRKARGKTLRLKPQASSLKPNGLGRPTSMISRFKIHSSTPRNTRQTGIMNQPARSWKNIWANFGSIWYITPVAVMRRM